ncbi:Extradiol ring-cleavage dioxygenase, class III enzyme, subunit B [Metarhizium album ARSEF 1941]|uniref:Extradiol ring-cleavage dioxygenase, class III enzyme, subunit B n=1 Tax=Metarhizium album (strain ARSEF 1941) TaxID=1081103 RepID=A0A0B2X7N1_METAS|nr:Extradiol ring-cleavage dioxygenase, class III enzyme, subunit B [Metarhizium album ARSEF 1941]KHO01276.1 Extradiol ring-cleavage dioxygenase, class III enzyme, subunit B [Metarhizium album ARSEF 1941]
MSWLSSRVLVASIAVAVAILLSPVSVMDMATKTKAYLQASFSNTTSATPKTKPPVYFFSHGGPTVQYDTDHAAYPVLQQIGKEITQKVRPKAVVVFSAHWAGEGDEIHVNKDEQADLIYELSFFYGFPDHYYQAKYPNKGDPQLASKIMLMLSEAGIASRGASRGLDHGVWSGFSVAFDPETNPLNVPLVQVSLFKSESPSAHYALGRAVSALRDEGVVIIGAGMSVHNLADLYTLLEGNTTPLPYTVSFDNALKEAVEADPELREDKMAAVCKRPDARQAHPYMDHLMPVFVAAGAAYEDKAQQTWTLHEGSMGWAQYRFGHVPQ